MAFTGNLKTIYPPELIQLIANTKKTGTLTVKRGEKTKEIYFKDGYIIYANSSSPEDMLENILIRDGKLSHNDIKRAHEIAQMVNKSLPSTLVYMNLITKEELATYTRKQVEKIIFSLFSWDEGEFTFEDEKLPDTDYMLVAINTMNILLESARYIDEWERIRKNIPPENTVLKLAPLSIRQQKEVRLLPEEVQVLSFIDGERSIEEIKECSGLDEIDTLKAIYSLLMSGYVQKVGVKESRLKKKITEREIIEIISAFYKVAYDTIKAAFEEKIGAATERLIRKTVDELKKQYPVLTALNITKGGEFDFSNFHELALKIPLETRYHELSLGLSELLKKLISLSHSLFGAVVKETIIKNIKENTKEVVDSAFEPLKNTGVYQDFTRALK